MGLLEDINTAINDYPSDNVDIEIINFTGPGPHVNDGEVWSFKVRVSNNGMLDMKDLVLHIEGSTWASVGGASGGPFSSSYFPPSQDVNAHSTVTFQTFYARMDQATGNGGTAQEDIIKAHISTYNASMDHIYKDHPHHASIPEAVKNQHIHPS